MSLSLQDVTIRSIGIIVFLLAKLETELPITVFEYSWNIIYSHYAVELPWNS